MPVATNLHLGHAGEAYPDAFYVRRGESGFVSTLHAQGAWQPGEQHLAPASGLVLAEVERRLPSAKLVSRASFDVLGVIQSGEFTIDVHMLRPGRSIELIGASMRHGERTSIRARIWRLAATDTAPVQGIEWAPLPPPDAMRPLGFSSVWRGGFIEALEARQTADSRPGRGRSWLRTRYPLVAGEADPPTAGFLKLVDTANGLVVRERPGSVFFANVDLTAHFLRQPEAGWVGFDTRVNFGPTGLGETFSVLSDTRGPVGTAVQSLTVRMGHDWQGSRMQDELAHAPRDVAAARSSGPFFTIREYDDALADDFRDINAEWITHSGFRLEPADIEVMDHPRATIIDAGGVILFVEDRGLGIIGTCALKKSGSHAFELTKMGVRESARGRKAGEFLLSAIIQRAMAMHADPLYLLSNTRAAAAIHLYEKLGFRHDREIMARYGAEYERCNVAMRYFPDVSK